MWKKEHPYNRFNTFPNDTKIRHEECGWEGKSQELEADYCVVDVYGEEMWSNWICPICKEWLQPEDYDIWIE